MESLQKKGANCQEKNSFIVLMAPSRQWEPALCWAPDSGVSYLYIEWNADEDIPTYRDYDSQEISLWKQTVNRHEIRWCSIFHTTTPNNP